MKSVARFVCRSNNNSPDSADVGIMMFLKGNDALKPNRIYEVQSVMGELLIKDLGPSAIGDDRNTSLIQDVSWCQDISTILDVGGRHAILTQGEYRALAASAKLDPDARRGK